jgi:hypothetical protein
MFPSHPLFRPSAGPSSYSSRVYSTAPPSRPRDSHKSYTGPTPSELSAPRSPEQAEKYFRRVAGDPERRLPTRTMKWLGVGGWVVGAGPFRASSLVPGENASLNLLRLPSVYSCERVYDSLCRFRNARTCVLTRASTVTHQPATVLQR